MSDLTKDLLAQYYGFSAEPQVEKFLSIHGCISNAENDADKLIDNQSTIDTNDDDTSKEMEEDDVESEKRNSEVDIPARSSRSLQWEALEDNNETTSKFDVIFEANKAGNFYENTNASCGNKIQDFTANNSTIISTTLGLEDNEGDDSYLSLSEEVSDVSSIAGRKKLKESSNVDTLFLTPLPNKTPTYNEIFIDLTSAGLVTLPIETIEKYPTIRMLYLENNDLLELPKELFLLLPRLQWLDVRNNRLTSLPASIKSHPSLETILLQGNKIETLPLELCLVPKLKTLSVADNPIATPPRSVIALGCSGILSYLRAEWNKLHPEEPATFVEQKIEPKPSNILCYQSPREKRRKLSKIPRRELKSTNDIGDSFKGASVRKRARAYRASNRCDGKGTNFAMEQRLYWISKARDLLSAQSATIQRIKDADTVKEWRRNKRSFSKSMEKVSRRNEDDVPFAIDIEDYPEIKKRPQKAGNYSDNRKQRKSKFAPPVNINKKIQELIGALQEFEITKSSEILTPKSKQEHLQNEIEKLSHFQKEVQYLRRYNEMTLAPMNSPNNTF
ncbi:PREDICTED: chaoptin-like [Dinoponera quadriceps]|uniref:Chaoptin-like n=1 Tax=Dinoponera quadriceps TaxID=609295 RepID=A0A6P3XQU0_DINQU|nr:PREDICTED: chaoptin-like [Dinoponera quadriceps]